jgi:hypothetical protein
MVGSECSRRCFCKSSVSQGFTLRLGRPRERTFAARAGTRSTAAVGASASSVTAASLHCDGVFGFGGKLLSVRLERVMLVVSLLGEERKRSGGQSGVFYLASHQ